MKLYQKLASLVQAYKNCQKSGNTEWQEKHRETIERLVKEHMPSGAGFDNGGTRFALFMQGPERLIFTTSFHHMNEHGNYDGWTEHEIYVKPSLASGFTLRVTGLNRNDIKDYIHECFHQALSTEVEP